MAMIRCPECGREVSDKAKNCVGCGYPIEANLYADMNNYANNNGVIRSNNTSAYNVENQNAIGQAVDTYSASVAPQKKKKYTVIKIVIGICILVFLFSFIKNIIGKTKEELASRNTVEEENVTTVEEVPVTNEETVDETDGVKRENEASYEVGCYLQFGGIEFALPKEVVDGKWTSGSNDNVSCVRDDGTQIIIFSKIDNDSKVASNELITASGTLARSNFEQYNIGTHHAGDMEIYCKDSNICAGGQKYILDTSKGTGTGAGILVSSDDSIIFILYVNSKSVMSYVNDLTEMVENARIWNINHTVIKDVYGNDIPIEKDNSLKDSSSSKDTTSSSVSPDLKAMLDEYEKFMDEYIDFMEKYQAGATTIEMLTEYTEILSKYTEFTNKINDVDQKELSQADAAYYLEVTMRVEKKLLNALK